MLICLSPSIASQTIARWMLLLIVASPTCAASAQSSPSATSLQFSLGPEINVGKALTEPPRNQYQCDLRHDPSDSDRMIITAKIGFEDHTAAFATDDGGQTWSVTRQWDSGDPDVAFDHVGNAYWTFIDGHGGNRQNSVRRSFDGGRTWQPKQLLIEKGFIDHPHVVVDRGSNSPHVGSIYFAGRYLSQSSLWVIRSHDRGTTWQTETVKLPPAIGNGFVHAMAVTEDGTLVIPIESQRTILSRDGRYDGSLATVHTIRSTDGGQTFDAPVHLGDKNHPARGGLGDARANSGVAAGRYQNTERLYFVFPRRRQALPTILMISTSDDAGQSWTEPRRLLPPNPSGNSSEPPSGDSVPTVMVNRDGVVGVAYYRFIANPARFDLYFTASVDGGEHFGDPIRISSQSSLEPPTASQAREPGGDQVYSDIGGDGTFRLVWTDNRDGDERYTIYYRKVTPVVHP